MYPGISWFGFLKSSIFGFVDYGKYYFLFIFSYLNLGETDSLLQNKNNFQFSEYEVFLLF